MNWRDLWLKARALIFRDRLEHELKEELDFHTEMQIRKNVQQGMTAAEARRQARLKFGSGAQVEEECRKARGFVLVESVLQDFRYALRQMRKDWRLASVAILTLALAIGANTAIFSIVDTVVLRPLDYNDEAQLVAIHETRPKFGSIPVNSIHFLEWQKTARLFDQMALIGPLIVNLTGSGEPERLAMARVSHNLFAMLGVRPKLGRTFTEEEDQIGHDRVVVLGNELWQRRFEADEGIIGRKIILDGIPFEVIGILPADFQFPKMSHLFPVPVDLDRPQIWKPVAVAENERRMEGAFNFAAIGKLKTGVSITQAVSELKAIQSEISTQIERDTTFGRLEIGADVVPLHDQLIRRSRNALELILAGVGIVLIIGCVNITNLLLARSSARARETAIRSAIGASRKKLIQQMLVEAFLLAGLGGIAGICTAYWAIPVIVALAPSDVPRLNEVQLDTRIFLFATGVSVLIGLFIGLLPALRSSNVDLHHAMNSQSRTATGNRGTGRLRALLVSVQIGLTATSLLSGGLLFRSFVKLFREDRGFDSRKILTVDLNFSRGRYPTLEKRAEFVRAALMRLKEIPGVISVGASTNLPLSGGANNSAMFVEGVNLPLFERPIADVRAVDPDFFQTFGVSFRDGRRFDAADRDQSVAVISISAAKQAWPGENPIGKRFRFGPPTEPMIQVVGLVNDVRGTSLDLNPSLTVYRPYWQEPFPGISLTLKTGSEPIAMFSSIRRILRDMDAELPIPQFRTMDDIVNGSVAQRRFQMNLILLFAVAAIILASLGIYGVTSFAVVQRTKEIGIRIALGASRRSVLYTTLQYALGLVGFGLLIGIPLALVATSVLRASLFGVSPYDSMTLSGTCFLITTVTLLAAYIPARRASRTDPMSALRFE